MSERKVASSPSKAIVPLSQYATHNYRYDTCQTDVCEGFNGTPYTYARPSSEDQVEKVMDRMKFYHDQKSQAREIAVGDVVIYTIPVKNPKEEE